MSMFQIFNVSGSAVSAQSQRLNTVASNLANVDTVAGPDGTAYKARQVVFQTELMGARQTQRPMGTGIGPMDPATEGVVGAAGVRVSTVVEDNSPGRRVHDPKNPSADADGYVTYSNVNAVEEMVNMISASRSYQNNIEVMNTAKTLLQKTLQMGQG
ncbi:flagellar basal body rod protein FlgC [Aquincola tertiaricarbonis]|uniref:Flagellar basal-body rod protein FlgC n=1 Tax=Aquincola tertiaricarbonis TaxID=391953 RepID=A0ABY4SI76_AQUTE|nr:flagellar basal body rod protein FlgC [Aquincola tertiaricarbonis]URI10874.1 flagellar basal body rod protein FlgC [Aquincola tertiaricarbonis]